MAALAKKRPPGGFAAAGGGCFRTAGGATVYDAHKAYSRKTIINAP